VVQNVHSLRNAQLKFCNAQRNPAQGYWRRGFCLLLRMRMQRRKPFMSIFFRVSVAKIGAISCIPPNRKRLNKQNVA
jgi:hypothetical protein